MKALIFLTFFSITGNAFAAKTKKDSDEEKEEVYKTKPAIRKTIKPEKSDAPLAYQKKTFMMLCGFM